jgi:hypothetical protein
MLQDEVNFLCDGKMYASFNSTGVPTSQWVFNERAMFIIVNLAIGGSWPGNPLPNATFPQAMLVDYVRVYKQS